MPKPESQISLLDVYVLFLIRDGMNTLYRLLREGGVSVGAATPAVKRLLKKGLIHYRQKNRKGDVLIGPRGKLQMNLSLFAHPFLQSQWSLPFEQDLPTDIESVARLVAIAEAENRTELAVTALDHAIAHRRKRGRQSLPVAQKSKIAAKSRSILQACVSARLKAEAGVLEKVRSGLK